MFTEPSVNYVFTEPSDHIVDDTAFNVLATGRTLDLKHKQTPPPFGYHQDVAFDWSRYVLFINGCNFDIISTNA